MAKMGKYISLFLVVALTFSSLLMIEPINAETIPKPSVPQFTVKYVDLSYDVPTTTSIDQYTGQTITHQGYHVENETLQLTIKNQPFTSYIDNGQNISFYYNIRAKGYFSDQWIEFYSPDNGYPTESRVDFTTITIVLGENSRFGYTPPNSKIDFQVQALIGSVHRISNITAGNQSPLEMFPWIFDGQTSSWSNTQTVTIPKSSTVSTSPAPTESQPNVGPTSSPISSHNDGLFMALAFVAIAILVFSLITVLLYVRHLKRSIPKT
ncbi:MAG TPA: hypothetical protein DGG95_09360 [Cytophagales bacterium]|jgi:hypothetical protein|nr:hypothetical protein [Cytophagales bacterium]